MGLDIRLDTRLTRHWKFKKLKRIIGATTLEHLVVFWATVAEQMPNGALNGWTPDDIEDAAEWTGEPGVLFAALLDCRFLDTTPQGFTPHDWAEHQPWIIGAPERSEAARKAGKASGAARKKPNGTRTENERDVNGPFNKTDEKAAELGEKNERNANGNGTPSPSPSPLHLKPIAAAPCEEEVRETAPPELAPEAEPPPLVRHETLSILEFRHLYCQTTGELLPGGLNNSAAELCRKHPREKIEAAFQEMAECGGKTFRYLAQILAGTPKSRDRPQVTAVTRGEQRVQSNLTAAAEALRIIEGGEHGPQHANYQGVD